MDERVRREATFIALLRGINVGGHNRMPMAELRAVAAGLGWRDVATYIQSGNVVFRAAGGEERLAEELEAAVERRFGLSIPVLVRRADDWSSRLAANPFPEASRDEPNLVMLALSRRPPRGDALETLAARASAGERILQTGDVLWIHYAAGAAKSRLSPGMLDRCVGSPVTTRNWRTAVRLRELAEGVGRGA
jgi:uncharacterized protein (DUF1697 family)